MSATILAFRKKQRIKCVGIGYARERYVDVFPMDGAWAWQEVDDGGASMDAGLTKEEAIRVAMEWAQDGNTTIVIHDRNIFEDEDEEGGEE